MRLFVLFFSLVSLFTQAASIKVGLHDSAPWAYRNAQGEMTGVDYEIVKAILQREGIEAEFELYSYNRLLKLFQNKNWTSPVLLQCLIPAHFTASPISLWRMLSRTKAQQN